MLDLNFIQNIIKDFMKVTEAMSCTIIDDDCFIIASENDRKFRSYEKEIMSFYLKILQISEKCGSFIDFYNNIEIISWIEEGDINFNGFKIFIKSINERVALLALLPIYLINQKTIEIEFNKTLSILHEQFNNLYHQKKAEKILLLTK